MTITEPLRCYLCDLEVGKKKKNRIICDFCGKTSHLVCYTKIAGLSFNELKMQQKRCIICAFQVLLRTEKEKSVRTQGINRRIQTDDDLSNTRKYTKKCGGVIVNDNYSQTSKIVSKDICCQTKTEKEKSVRTQGINRRIQTDDDFTNTRKDTKKCGGVIVNDNYSQTSEIVSIDYICCEIKTEKEKCVRTQGINRRIQTDDDFTITRKDTKKCGGVIFNDEFSQTSKIVSKDICSQTKTEKEKSVRTQGINRRIQTDDDFTITRKDTKKCGGVIFNDKYSQTSKIVSKEICSQTTFKNVSFKDSFSETSELNGTTQTSAYVSPIDKNLMKYFTDFDIPQIVILHLKSPGSVNSFAQKFICNSVILAFHSEKFDKLILAGSTTIYVEGFNPHTVRKSLEYMYGNNPVIDKHVEIINILKFATVWSISSLCEVCLAKIDTKVNANPLEIVDYLPILDLSTDESKRYLDTMTVFKNIIKMHADELIDLFVKDKAYLETLTGRLSLFQTLIGKSKSPQCVIFLTSLLSASERSKRAVLNSLHHIRVDSKFSGAKSFATFHQFLYSCFVILDGNEDDFEKIRTFKLRFDRLPTKSVSSECNSISRESLTDSVSSSRRKPLTNSVSSSGRETYRRVEFRNLQKSVLSEWNSISPESVTNSAWSSRRKSLTNYASSSGRKTYRRFGFCK